MKIQYKKLINHFQQIEIDNEKKEFENQNNEEDEENEQSNLSKIKITPKKESKIEISLNESQSLTIKLLKAGDIISFKELNYYSSTAICSQGTIILKIGTQQIQNLKVYRIWQDYFQESKGEQTPYNQLSVNKNNQFECNYDRYIQKYRFIKSIPLFQNIYTDIIDQTFNLAIYSQGDFIYKEQDPAKFIYIIFEGEVEILMQNSLSNHSTISHSPSLSPKKNLSPCKQNQFMKASILSSGSIFGEEEIITYSLRSFTARTSSKKLLLYKLPIFLFLDLICRQNEEVLDKLILNIQNKQRWRDSQISSIKRTQIKLNQFDSSNILQINNLNDNFNRQLIYHRSEINIPKYDKQVSSQNQQNFDGKLQKKSFQNMRNEISPFKIYSKMTLNPFLLPKLFVSRICNKSSSMSKDKIVQAEMDLDRKIESRNSSERSNQMDQEESSIKKQIKIKQKVFDNMKMSNTITINNNQFPSFEKPLIPIPTEVELGLKNNNDKYLISSNTQNRNSSQPHIEHNASIENLNTKEINNKVKQKLFQNIQSINQNFIPYQSNNNFQNIMDNIDIEVQKDLMKISKIENSLYQQSVQQLIQSKQQKQQHNFQQFKNENLNLIQNKNLHIKYNLNYITNSHVNSMQNFNLNSSRIVSQRSSKQYKEQNRSMDNIYSQFDKSNYKNKLSSRNIFKNDTSSINSYRNPYLNDEKIKESSFQYSAFDLSPSQIGTQIDKNLKHNSKLGSYFRINKSFLLQKAELKEKSNKEEQKLHKIQIQQIKQNNIFQQNQTTIPINGINSIYQSLEKYRQLENSPQKASAKRSQSIKDQLKRDQNEQTKNNIRRYLEKMNLSRDFIKNLKPKYLNSIPQLNLQNTQKLFNNNNQDILGKSNTERQKIETKQREFKSPYGKILHKISCECKLCKNENRKNSFSNQISFSEQVNGSSMFSSLERLNATKRINQFKDGKQKLFDLLNN